MAERTPEEELLFLEGRIAALQTIMAWTLNRLMTTPLLRADFIAMLRTPHMTAAERADLGPSYLAGKDTMHDFFLDTLSKTWKIDLDD